METYFSYLVASAGAGFALGLIMCVIHWGFGQVARTLRTFFTV